MLVIGFIIGAEVHLIPGADLYEYRKLKSECEQNLPRNQTCKLIAVINYESTRTETKN